MRTRRLGGLKIGDLFIFANAIRGSFRAGETVTVYGRGKTVLEGNHKAVEIMCRGLPFHADLDDEVIKCGE